MLWVHCQAGPLKYDEFLVQRVHYIIRESKPKKSTFRSPVCLLFGLFKAPHCPETASPVAISQIGLALEIRIMDGDKDG